MLGFFVIFRLISSTSLAPVISHCHKWILNNFPHYNDQSTSFNPVCSEVLSPEDGSNRKFLNWRRRADWLCEWGFRNGSSNLANCGLRNQAAVDQNIPLKWRNKSLSQHVTLGLHCQYKALIRAITPYLYSLHFCMSASIYALRPFPSLPLARCAAFPVFHVQIFIGLMRKMLWGNMGESPPPTHPPTAQLPNFLCKIIHLIVVAANQNWHNY